MMPRFFVLTPPEKILYFNGFGWLSEQIPVAWKDAKGGRVPAILLDTGCLNPWNVCAAMVFPADQPTQHLFARTHDTYHGGELRTARGGRIDGTDFPLDFAEIRWVRPENIRILRRL